MNANTTTPSDRNPVLADNGDVRVGKLIGSSIYNDKGDKIGSVDDVLVAADQKATHVILSIGGFLGMGAKLVSVPYDQLKFGDTNAKSENRVMLPGATRDALNNMQEFHYTNTNG
ncbi:MAG TPA: PRC-barrel domain-containing protein [Acetobacteraceae bacterium]|nr:PRC-barrel domain-containing protein [Acetobacteraceae bacterium]